MENFYKSFKILGKKWIRGLDEKWNVVNNRVNSKKVVKSFRDSAFKQIDDTTVSLEQSIKKDFTSFYEFTNKISTEYEDGYDIVIELMKLANGEGDKKETEAKVRKIGSKK